MPNVKISYNQSINGIKNDRIKGLLAEVSGLIEGEMNDDKAKKSVIPVLFNETKSDKHIESIAVEDGYDLMDPQFDGDKAKSDKTNIIGRKSVSHIQFGKLVSFTETMVEDAYAKMDPTIEMKARQLPNSYWRTREAFGQGMYINGESASWNFRGEKVDLTTYDEKPLFATDHTYGGDAAHASGEQSNLYYVELGDNYTAGDLAEVLAAGNELINQMLTSNGEAQCFDADTILVPRGVNNAIFVDKVRRATGSDFFPGTSADLNTQKGIWDVVPLSLWNPAGNEIILMSQDAKKMMKSMFYNRINLGINVWKDENTGNINYRGRTRFSAVHVDYKHVIKIKINPTSTNGLTQLVI